MLSSQRRTGFQSFLFVALRKWDLGRRANYVALQMKKEEGWMHDRKVLQTTAAKDLDSNEGEKEGNRRSTV